MRRKIISLALALFYFSVTVILSGPHAHNHSKTFAHQQECIACAWHFECNADAPTGPTFISVPPLVLIHTPAPDIQAECLKPRAPRDRGPPIPS